MGESVIPSFALVFALTVSPQNGQEVAPLEGSFGDPAVSRDGRIAFALDGDLWVGRLRVADDATLSVAVREVVQVTRGPAWDRQPSWGPESETLVFSSDRSGNFDLWTVRIGGGDEPRRLTDSPEADADPTTGPDGTIVFVRGRNANADLWVREPDGTLRALTDGRGADLSPTLSPDGARVAYVNLSDRRRQLRLRDIDGTTDRVVVGDLPAEFPAWSHGGEYIAFTTRGSRPGVWIAPDDGSFTNLVSRRGAAAAWTSDDAFLTLAELPPPGPGYNGDPDRTDRTIDDVLDGERRLWVVRVPLPPDSEMAPVVVRAVRDRAARNMEAFDRVWQRLQNLYFAGHEAEVWRALGERFRPRAVAAADDEALQDVIYTMMREAPTRRREAQGPAAVSSAHPLATAAGVEILEAGGNVVDAAVAVSFALGVVEPDASGIAGYGEMVLYRDGMSEPIVIEFLTRVPQAATLDNAGLLVGGRLPPDGPVLPNVPGTVAGMWKAWNEHGSGNIAWADLVAPAIRLADDGFALDDGFTTTLALERTRFEKYESSRRLFFPEGQPLQAGQMFRNPDLAWTLREIAAGGADAFYRGEIARRMVSDLGSQGNAMTMEDLARYFAVEREPIQGTYRGHTVYSAAPAASGGVSLVSKLNLLERFDRPRLYTDDAPTLHAMIEAWKLQPSASGRLADPSLWPIDVEPLLHKDTARVRWNRCFDANRSTGLADLRRGRTGGPVCAEAAPMPATGRDGRGEPEDCEDDALTLCRSTGTTSFSVADADGNMVAVTQTLGTWGGNFYVTPGLGFLYNDKLRSYSTNPSSYNARIPYARNTTSISPTLIFRGTGADREPMAAVGAAGNAWITSAVYQVTAAMIDAGIGPQRALELPRFLVGIRRNPAAAGGGGAVVQLEDGIAPEVLRRLREMGHRFQMISLPGELRMGYGAAVLVERGRVRAGGDPRRSGTAMAVRR